MVKRSIPFKVYLTPTENEMLQARVDAAGLSRSQYGHLVLTSPFSEELKQAKQQRQEKRELCSLLAKQHVTLSLIEAHLAELLEGEANRPGLQALLQQLHSELRQTQTEVGELNRWLRSEIVEMK